MIPAKDLDHAIAIANDTSYGLNSAVFSGDPKAVSQVGRKLRAGNVGHNGMKADFSLPFGGFKQSGVGREGGAEGLMPYVETKVMLIERPRRPRNSRARPTGRAPARAPAQALFQYREGSAVSCLWYEPRQAFPPKPTCRAPAGAAASGSAPSPQPPWRCRRPRRSTTRCDLCPSPVFRSTTNISQPSCSGSFDGTWAGSLIAISGSMPSMLSRPLPDSIRTGR